MPEEGFDLTPLNNREVENLARRQAAGFALITFADVFENHYRQARIGVELSEEQVRFAKNLREVWPHFTSILPETGMNATRSGYGHISSSILETIPMFLENPDYRDFKGWEEGEKLKQLMKDDPSGVSLLRYQLAEMEEKAKKSADISDEKLFSTEVMYAAIDAFVENMPEKRLDMTIEGYPFLDALYGAFNQNAKERAREEEYYKIFKETGLVLDENGKAVPYDVLRLAGARFGFDKYKRAVDFYLNRWGPSSDL